MSKRKFMSSKEKMKRKIFIGFSSAAIITLCGVVGFNYILSGNGQIRKSVFGGRDINSFSDQSEEESNFVLNKDTLKQIDSMLSQLGFGYKKENIANYNLEDYETAFDRTDPEGTISLPERLYMFENDFTEEDRPEYVKEPPVLNRFIADTLVDKATVKVYYECWKAAGQPGDAFDIENFRTEGARKVVDIIFSDGRKKVVEAVYDIDDTEYKENYQEVKEGTVSKQQVELYKILKTESDAFLENTTENRPNLKDKRVINEETGETEYKYIDFTVVTEISEYMIEEYYKEWVKLKRPEEAYLSELRMCSYNISNREI